MAIQSGIFGDGQPVSGGAVDEPNHRETRCRAQGRVSSRASAGVNAQPSRLCSFARRSLSRQRFAIGLRREGQDEQADKVDERYGAGGAAESAKGGNEEAGEEWPG